MMTNEHHFNRPTWDEITKDRLNTQLQTKWDFLEKKRKGIYVESSPGMLMGMHNALSTTVALAAVGYGLDIQCQEVVTLRSSDDSTSAYFGVTLRDVYIAYSNNNRIVVIEIARNQHEPR